MVLQRVERHIIKDKRLDELTFLSKNLYNYTNYCIRQSFIKSGLMPSEYDLTGKFAKREQVDYKGMPSAQSAQQTVKLLFKNWKSFFKANKEYNKNPSKFKARPKMPRYKEKHGKNIVVFTAQNAKIKDGFVHFPKKANIEPIKTKVSSLVQVRIIPQATCTIVEIVYKKEKKQVDVVNETWLSIDLGLNNLVTSFNNIGKKPFIVNGKIIKSINQYYNKKKAKLMSFIGDRGISNKINRLTHKRNMKINDYMHKTSRYIIDYAIEQKLEKIIIGDNVDWKQSINIGKKNNQKFVSIPHAKLIEQIQYKAEEVGIEVVLTEESYTSKTDHFALEPLKKHGCDKVARPTLGKRIKRGLFRSSTGRILNADTNGAIGIARKVICESSISELLANRGVVTTPFRVQL